MYNKSKEKEVFVMLETNESSVFRLFSCFEYMSNETFRLLLQEPSLSAICEKVLDHCLAPCTLGEGCDNMTIIIVQLN